MKAAMVAIAVVNMIAAIAMLFALRASRRADAASKLAAEASRLASSEAANALRAIESVSSSRVSLRSLVREAEARSCSCSHEETNACISASCQAPASSLPRAHDAPLVSSSRHTASSLFTGPNDPSSAPAADSDAGLQQQRRKNQDGPTDQRGGGSLQRPG